MGLPKLTEIREMSIERLEQLSETLALSNPGESFQATATRLYMDGRDDEAFVYQHMFWRLSELFEPDEKKGGQAPEL